MHVLQAHAINPWSEGEEHNHGQNIPREDNTHERVADKLQRKKECQRTDFEIDLKARVRW